MVDGLRSSFYSLLYFDVGGGGVACSFVAEEEGLRRGESLFEGGNFVFRREFFLFRLLSSSCFFRKPSREREEKPDATAPSFETRRDRLFLLPSPVRSTLSSHLQLSGKRASPRTPQRALLLSASLDFSFVASLFRFAVDIGHRRPLPLPPRKNFVSLRQQRRCRYHIVASVRGGTRGTKNRQKRKKKSVDVTNFVLRFGANENRGV